MNEPESMRRLEAINVTIEGEADLTVRPWKGPIGPRPDAKSEGYYAEQFWAEIDGEPDLTVRPRRRPSDKGARPE